MQLDFSILLFQKGEARIRLQITSEHTKKQLDEAIEIFGKVGKN